MSVEPYACTWTDLAYTAKERLTRSGDLAKTSKLKCGGTEKLVAARALPDDEPGAS
jgi:hypothetical protein